MAKVTKTFQISWDAEKGEHFVTAASLMALIGPDRFKVADVEEIDPAQIIATLKPDTIYVMKVKNWTAIDGIEGFVEAAAANNIRMVLLPPDIDVVGKGSIPDIIPLLQDALKGPDRCEDCGRPDCQQCE